MMSINLTNVAILIICGVDGYCIIKRIRKIETLNLLQNAHLSEKSRSL